ncbi:MAG: alcohol dehydrogenase catalytic domain-containing protein [Deltaproteobacteria bacterium]|nr:alcohol dehydrogenase catalytic domain-containing protein [Deltaproteobacteria bacterium]
MRQSEPANLPAFMPAARLHGPGDLRLETLPCPACPPRGAVVRVRAAGICASDLKMFRAGHKELTLPRVLGHETAGEVAAVGPEVRGWRPGDPVLVFPGLVCGECPACRAGRDNLCAAIRVLGFSADGGMAGYLAVEEADRALIPLPPGLSPVTATLAEPLACGLNALSRAGLAPGEAVVVLGAGVVGRLAAAAARARGAGTVLLADLNPARLTAWAGPSLDASAGDPVARARELLGGGAAVVIPANPAPEALAWGLDLLALGGRLVLFSGLKQSLSLDLNRLHYGEQTLTGAYGCTLAQCREALGLLATGQAPAADLVSRVLPLAAAPEAFRLAASGDYLKIVLEP